MLKRLKYKDVKPIYKIDEYGNVFSEYKNDYLNPKKDKNGYLSLALAGKNKIIYAKIATLVIYNYIGEPPSKINDPTVDHIDGNILNNYYKNLRWLSRSENSSIRKERAKSVGELNHEAKLTEKEVIEICELLIKNELSFKEIAKIYNIHKSTVSNIKRKKNWKHISEKYNFPKIIIKRERGKFTKITDIQK